MSLDWPTLRTDDVDMVPYDQRNEYVSVIVTYCKAQKPDVDRASLLERCIDSLHRHADMPFEVLVHDDTGIELTSLNVKDRITTLILNMGENMRQPVAQNRMVKLATSRYIMLIEDDIELTRPCFKDMTNILKKPYVGFINPEGRTEEEMLVSDETRFVISGHLSGSWITAFRKDTWKHVGGFAEWSHVSGPVFCFSCFKKGYWRGWFNETIARDVDLEEHDNEWRTRHVFGRQNIPRIFKMDPATWQFMSNARHSMSMKNYNEAREIDGSASNFKYWAWWWDALNKPNKCISSINWEIAKIHGQDRWRKNILEDVSSWRATGES